MQRDPALTSPVALAINDDALSTSNITSFMLIGPEAGWTEPLTELGTGASPTPPPGRKRSATLPSFPPAADRSTERATIAPDWPA